MTPGARIQAAIEILDTILVAVSDRGPAADHVVRKYMRGRRYIGSADRRAVSALVYEVLRDAVRLAALVRAGDAKAGARSLVLAHLSGTDPTQIGHFNGANYSPQIISPEEQDFVSKCQTNGYKINRMAALNCPDWASAGMEERFGDGLPEAMAVSRQRAPTAFRLNLLAGVTREAVLDELAGDGIAARAGVFSPTAVIATDGSTMRGHKLVRTGLLVPQDEGTQIAALMLEAQPGEQIADFCAGSGGKSLALAGLMANRGQIHALDGSEGRLASLKKQAQVAGARNIQSYVEKLGGKDGPFVKSHKAAIDRVLVDAPCTGSGTWRRNPELRLRWSTGEVSEFAQRQYDMLSSAASLVRGGGSLVYVTCSLLPEENEKVVERFLRHNIDWMTEDYGDVWRRVCTPLAPSPESPLKGALQLTPSPDGPDGVFIVRLRKT